MRLLECLVQIQFNLALVTFHRAAKNSIAAAGTNIARLFVADPSLSAEFSPIWHGPEDDFFADCHRKIVNVRTRKVIAFMTPGIAFHLCTIPDLALVAVHELFSGQAATASNAFYCQRFRIREHALASSSSPVEVYQLLLQFDIVIAVCNINCADPAVETAGRNQIRIYCHSRAHTCVH
jgi:hypothetical protein